jgi:hypothetical protein
MAARAGFASVEAVGFFVLLVSVLLGGFTLVAHGGLLVCCADASTREALRVPDLRESAGM